MEITKYSFKGTSDKDLAASIIAGFQKLGIQNCYVLSSHDCYYFVVDKRVQRISRDAYLGTLQYIPADQYLMVLNDDIKKYCWFENLKVGDEVVITERVGKANDYPYIFVDDMAMMSGRVFKIKRIRKNYCIEKNVKYYNGDRNAYELEAPDEFTWHSSMFEPINVTPVQKLTFSQLSILSRLN